MRFWPSLCRTALAGALVAACGSGPAAGPDPLAAPESLPASCLGGVCQAAIEGFGFGGATTAATAAAAGAGANEGIGFDLDGRVSERGDREGCGVPDKVSPEGVAGIDNQLGNLLTDLGDTIAIVDDLVQDSVNEGGVLYVVEIAGYDGPGDAAATGRLLDIASTPLVGNDDRILPGQTLRLDPDPLMAELAFEVGPDGTFATAEPFDMRLPVQILDVDEDLFIRQAQLRFRLGDDGRLAEGVIGGGLEIAGIVQITENYAVGDEIRAAVPPLLNLLADLRGTDGDCDQLSVALTWEAVPVFALAASEPVPATAPTGG